MLGPIPANIQKEVDLSFEISDRIDSLMRQRGLSKKQFADALGRRPSEITKWLSGQHNFTIATLAMLSSFFGQPIVTVGWRITYLNNEGEAAARWTGGGLAGFVKYQALICKISDAYVILNAYFLEAITRYLQANT